MVTVQILLEVVQDGLFYQDTRFKIFVLLVTGNTAGDALMITNTNSNAIVLSTTGFIS